MEEMAISKFKATCLAALERVRKTRRPIRVTKFGRPIADTTTSSSGPPGSERRSRMLVSRR